MYWNLLVAVVILCGSCLVQRMDLDYIGFPSEKISLSVYSKRKLKNFHL